MATATAAAYGSRPLAPVTPLTPVRPLTGVSGLNQRAPSQWKPRQLEEVNTRNSRGLNTLPDTNAMADPTGMPGAGPTQAVGLPPTHPRTCKTPDSGTLPPLTAVLAKSSKFFQQPAKFHTKDLSADEVDYSQLLVQQKGDITNIEEGHSEYQKLLETYNGGVLTKGPKVAHPWVPNPLLDDSKAQKLENMRNEEDGLIKNNNSRRASSLCEAVVLEVFGNETNIHAPNGAPRRASRTELAPRPPSHKRRSSAKLPPAAPKGQRPALSSARSQRAKEAMVPPQAEYFSSTLRAAAVAPEEAKKAMEKNEAAAMRMRRDNVLLEDLEAQTKALMDDDVHVHKPLFMPKPPTSTYEACANIGVESAALAAMCPPALLSPRYKAHNTPKPKLTPELLQAKMRAEGLFVRNADGKNLEPRAAASDVVTADISTHGAVDFSPRPRTNYEVLLASQRQEFEAAEESYAGYQQMMADYDAEQAMMFAKNREFVEKGGHFMPLDQTNRLKLQLARMIGIAPKAVPGGEVPLQ